MELGAWSKMQMRITPTPRSVLPAPANMPIQVTCPGCLKRFSVADKFAGQKGPCPKCKQIITIPKKQDEVIIHAPDHSETGHVDASGRNVLKNYKRMDTKFQPLLFTAVIAAD